MGNDNIHYESDEMIQYFSKYRQTWTGFYESERKIFETLNIKPDSTVLDMGCACGGLAGALREKFDIRNYLGVDIHSGCIRAAKNLHPWAKFIDGDFLQASKNIEKDFDVAFSMSCADWNVKTEELFKELFLHVKEGGKMVFSCRMSPEISPSDRVFTTEQEINYSGNSTTQKNYELASYKVYRPSAIIDLIRSFSGASSAEAYGYWGSVPSTVHNLPWNRLFYAVFSVQKDTEKAKSSSLRLKLDFDADLLF